MPDRIASEIAAWARLALRTGLAVATVGFMLILAGIFRIPTAVNNPASARAILAAYGLQTAALSGVVSLLFDPRALRAWRRRG